MSLRNVDPDDIKMESIRADAEDEFTRRHPGKYWDAERLADELYFGEGREEKDDVDDEDDDYA